MKTWKKSLSICVYKRTVAYAYVPLHTQITYINKAVMEMQTQQGGSNASFTNNCSVNDRPYDWQCLGTNFLIEIRSKLCIGRDHKCSQCCQNKHKQSLNIRSHCVVLAITLLCVSYYCLGYGYDLYRKEVAISHRAKLIDYWLYLLKLFTL